MSSQKILIVGQGIAGSVLAWHLLKAGHSITVADDNHRESSTIISAGIINPITGQRLAVLPQFDLFFKSALATYDQMSADLGIELFVPKPIIRVLRSREEFERARYLQNLTSAQPYISGLHEPGYYGNGLIDPFGTLTIAQGGYLQTYRLLTALKRYLIDRQILVEEELRYDDLIIKEHGVSWKNQLFGAVIFCEGFKAKGNPWFKDLPYNFAKGEILRIAFDAAALPDAILCQQQWCLPQDDASYLAGSTYDRENINTQTTDEGQKTILKGLNDFIPSTVRVLNAWAAVRPVMLNPKPVMAFHPSNPRLAIFNGFASKGILWAPYYANQLIHSSDARRILTA
ncbi:MAG: FAD-binding oxidoreductase [Candidatus Omnitrophica bacterium]|nr:FAD-binding oxidoreductase [Candidatus Omnitrophota bacterium]